MNYYDVKKKQILPNREIDKFLTQLHMLCKKHNMCMVTAQSKYPLIVRSYSKESVKHMLLNVHNDLDPMNKKESTKQKDKTDKNK